MRLLEDEVRMASITASAPGPSLMTQASNFSFCRRCSEFAGNCTASMPNCRKQSARIVFVVSLRSTKAMRAAAFLVWAIGAKAVPKAFSIVLGPNLTANLFCNEDCLLAKIPTGQLRVQKCHYVGRTEELLWSLVSRAAQRLCRRPAASGERNRRALGETLIKCGH